MDLSKLKNWKVITGIVLGVVVLIVLVTIITVVIVSTRGYTCKLENFPPSVEVDALENIHSSQLDTLATFSGYIEFNVDPSGFDFPDNASYYLQLNLTQVSLFQWSQPKLHLLTNCAEIILFLDRLPQYNIWTVKSIQLIPSGTLSGTVEGLCNIPENLFEWCSISKTGIEFQTGSSYACYRPKRFACDTRSGRSLYLNMYALQFELYGDPAYVKRGIYSRPIQQCS